jgi:hypothetical protein
MQTLRRFALTMVNPFEMNRGQRRLPSAASMIDRKNPQRSGET